MLFMSNYIHVDQERFPQVDILPAMGDLNAKVKSFCSGKVLVIITPKVIISISNYLPQGRVVTNQQEASDQLRI